MGKKKKKRRSWSNPRANRKNVRRCQVKTGEAMHDGLHTIFGAVGFFHPAGSIGDGALHILDAGGNLVQAGGNAVAVGWNELVGDEKAKNKRIKARDESLNSAGEHMKDAFMDAVWLIPYAKILGKLGKMLKLAKMFRRLFKAGNILVKFEAGGIKFTTKATVVTRAEMINDCQSRLLKLMKKEYGELAVETIQGFGKSTFKNYKELIEKWQKSGATAAEIADMIQSITSQIVYICQHAGIVYDFFEKTIMPDWLKKNSDKEMDALSDQIDQLEKEAEEIERQNIGVSGNAR